MRVKIVTPEQIPSSGIGTKVIDLETGKNISENVRSIRISPIVIDEVISAEIDMYCNCEVYVDAKINHIIRDSDDITCLGNKTGYRTISKRSPKTKQTVLSKILDFIF